MTRRLLLLGLLLVAAPAVSIGQTFTPQSPAGLSVTFTTERAGGTRVLVFGEVRNSNTSPAQHVVVVAEGLDESGRVVSRARVCPRGPPVPRERALRAAHARRREREALPGADRVVRVRGRGRQLAWERSEEHTSELQSQSHIS